MLIHTYFNNIAVYHFPQSSESRLFNKDYLELLSLIKTHPNGIIVSLQQVKDINLHVISLLAQCQQTANAARIPLCFSHVSPGTLQILSITGLDQALVLLEQNKDALKWLMPGEEQS